MVDKLEGLVSADASLFARINDLESENDQSLTALTTNLEQQLNDSQLRQEEHHKRLKSSSFLFITLLKLKQASFGKTNMCIAVKLRIEPSHFLFFSLFLAGNMGQLMSHISFCCDSSPMSNIKFWMLHTGQSVLDLRHCHKESSVIMWNTQTLPNQ